MKAAALACLALATLGNGRASPADEAIVAAMKLTETPNYSWVTTIDDDARSYTIDGQTNLADKNDFSQVDLPMIAALRRRAMRNSANSDNQATAIYRGDEKVVIQTPTGWRKPDELASASRPTDYGPASGGGVGGYGGMGGFGGHRSRHGMGEIDASGDGSRDRMPPYSNLQLTLSRPHEEIAIIVANYSELKVEEGVASGTLSELAAKLLLVHSGQKELTPLKASGTFRLWIKDGVLVKYEVKLEGTLAVNTNGNRREVQVHQAATTELKNVGTTKFDVPDEAKKKLGA